MPYHRTALASYRPGGPCGTGHSRSGAREGESFRNGPLGWRGHSLAGRSAPTPATDDPGGLS